MTYIKFVLLITSNRVIKIEILGKKEKPEILKIKAGGIDLYMRDIRLDKSPFSKTNKIENIKCLLDESHAILYM